MTVAAGSVIDHYRIERPVGTGAFATVYLAHDDRLDDVVALKVLAENRSLDVDARRRFVEEAQKLRAVRSPSVVSVYDVGEMPTHQPYMVLEYADRGDLAARSATLGRPVNHAELGVVIDFLTDALSALHRNGLVHRDVKPQNMLLASRPPAGERPFEPSASPLLVGGDERLLLGDLGFVKDLEAASGYTVGGGTAAFRAPEQAAALGTVDHRADLFAASAVVVWLLTGVAPTDSSGWSPLLASAAASTIPPPLAAALTRGLAPHPAHRQPTIDAWRRELVAALRPERAPVSTRSPASGRVAVALVAVLVTAVLVAAGWWFVAARGDDATTVVDGIARTERRVGPATVAIVGPDEVVVGETAVFRVEVDGAATTGWIEADGRVVDTTSERTLLPRSEGRFRVAIIATVPGERPTVVVHEAYATRP